MKSCSVAQDTLSYVWKNCVDSYTITYDGNQYTKSVHGPTHGPNRFELKQFQQYLQHLNNTRLLLSGHGRENKT